MKDRTTIKYRGIDITNDLEYYIAGHTIGGVHHIIAEGCSLEAVKALIDKHYDDLAERMAPFDQERALNRQADLLLGFSAGAFVAAMIFIIGEWVIH